MRIFLTGGTGYIGSAVLDALLRNRHSVTVLVRDPEKAERMTMRGVQPAFGDLADASSYSSVVEGFDAIVHTAFERGTRGPEVDRRAIDALLGGAIRRAARGQTVTFVYTSDTWVLGNTGGAADESAPPRPTSLVAWRPEHEQVVLDAGRGRMLRTAVIRPGIAYGGARGIVADLLNSAANGLVRVIGDGRNRWACVYVRDLADLYLRILTQNQASGVFHATDEADERVGDVVDALAQQMKWRPDIRHVPIEEARAKMGLLADALALNQIVRSPRARALGWSPTLHSVAGNVPRLLEEFRTAREEAA